MNLMPIKESELQAYVDDALPEGGRSDVELYLSEHPDEAERIGEYRKQKQALRELFAPLLDEPIPESLRRLAVAPQGAAGADATPPAVRPDFLSRWSLERLAAALFIALLGGAGGWLAHDQYQASDAPSRMVSLPRQAAGLRSGRRNGSRCRPRS